MPTQLPPDDNPDQNYSENEPRKIIWLCVNLGIILAFLGGVGFYTVSGIKSFIKEAEEASRPIDYPQWKFICDRKLKICSKTYTTATKPDGPEKILIKNIRYIQSTSQRKRQGTEHYVNLLLAGDNQVTGRTVQLNVRDPGEGQRLSKAISAFLQNPKQQKLDVIYTQGSYYLW